MVALRRWLVAGSLAGLVTGGAAGCGDADNVEVIARAAAIVGLVALDVLTDDVVVVEEGCCGADGAHARRHRCCDCCGGDGWNDRRCNSRGWSDDCCCQ